MSDWRLVNKEGELVWTSPAVPNGGQNLFTVMSPTLILGCAKKGDTLPVNYIKLPDVTRVSMSTPTGILLERRTGSSVLLVCHAGPQEAAVWLESIQRAVGGSGSLAASPKVGSKQQQPQPAAATTANSNSNQAPTTTSDSSNKNPASNASTSGPIQDPKLAGIATALQNDIKSKPIAKPDSTPIVPPSQNQNQQQQQGSNTSAGSNSKNNANANNSITPPSAGNAVQLPVISGDSASPDPAHPHSAAAPFMKNNNTNNNQQQPAPLSLAQLASTNNNNNNNNLPKFGANNNTNQLLGRNQQQTPVDIRSIGNTNNNNNNVDQQQQPTTPAGSVSTPVSSFRPGNQNQQPSIPNVTPLAATRTEKNQFEVITPGTGSSNNFNNSAVRPIVAPPLGQGGFNQNLNNNNNSTTSNSNFGSGVFGNNNNNTSFRTGNGSMLMMNNNNNNTSATATPTTTNVDALPDGSLLAAARRRGMLVDLPATQNVNRSIAPNASALWKEWRDPNGVLYVLHEATGTLQRLEPGDDKFQTFYTDEQLERMAADPNYHPEDQVPCHMEGDATLDMETMRVSNLHHYGRTGAAQAGVPYPDIPSGDLLREMVVPVPRGQFSPTRRAQVEPLAVPRVGDAGYKGKRIHRFTLAASDDPRVAVVEHQVQSLETEGLRWDPRTNQISARNAQQEQTIGNVTLRRQWEHVKSVLMQGRYFKKHAYSRPGTSSFRYIFLSSDTAWVCSVPTSDVMVKIVARNEQLQVGPESQQYFPPDTKAVGVNAIEEVVLGIEVPELRGRGRDEMDLNSTFVILSARTALILECSTPEEARFFCDAWNFFLFYSKPEQPARTPQMTAPITYGTRGGVLW
jgi:hypothetical protein